MFVNQEEAMNLVYTTGELFPDGDAAEQVSGGRLLLWKQREGRATIEPTLFYGHQRYAPASLDPSLQLAIRLPSDVAPFGTAAGLLEELANEYRMDSSQVDAARLL